MGTISLVIPQIGQPDTTEDVKVQNAFTTIQAAINGNIDSTNVSATLAQSAAVNQSGQTVKGVSVIATSEARSNVAYGTLTTPDQVTNVVLPANGLIAVWYQATWSSSNSGAGSAAIFLGANQTQVVGVNATAPSAASAVTANALVLPLTSTSSGLVSGQAAGNYTGDVTTGQILGLQGTGIGGISGPCYIFAAAGTYTVSIQFKASSGSVTALNRKLWVQALSFA